jgi:hypothetical protein
LNIKANSRQSQTDECRTEVLRDLARWFPARTFRRHHLDEFAHWLRQLDRNRWTRSTILEARNNPMFIAWFGREGLKDYFGRTRPRKPWMVIARLLAGLLISALRDLDGKRRGFGTPDGPVIGLTHQWLGHLLGEAAVPKPETLHRKLNEAARSSGRKPFEKRRRRRQPPGRRFGTGARRSAAVFSAGNRANTAGLQGRSLECIGLTLPC